jgi:tetratricopeptide (TPR) repeat protein
MHEWRTRERERLAAYITPEAARWLPVPSPMPDREDRDARARAAYESLSLAEINYELETYHPSAAIQLIRSPQEVCSAPRFATCLDLAVTYAGVCLAYELLPILVVFDDHAIVLVHRTLGLRDWDASHRREYPTLAGGPMPDSDIPRALIESSEYLAVECSGCARYTRRDPPEPMPYTQALAAGAEMLATRAVSFAIDVAIAHYEWRIDPTILDTHDTPTPSAPRRTPPSTLPRDIDVKAREQEITELLADEVRNPAGAEVLLIDAVDGMAGVGKTTLAVHAAHLLKSRYPDAQLFIDLHGYTEGQDPMTPEDALAVLLRAMGMPSERVPLTLEERTADWRATMAGKRAVIVLDNARSNGQVQPLIPGTPGSRVIVTSRRRLGGIASSRLLSLATLRPEGARELLRAEIGAQRAVGQDDAIAAIVELCGNLPLALQLASARLRRHPHLTPSEFATRLSEQAERLTLLSAQDLGVAATFNLSYDSLHDGGKRLIRALALHPGRAITVNAAAALANVTTQAAQRSIDELFDEHLLEEPRPGSYQFHDLMRDHIRDLVECEEDEYERTEALLQLCDYYLTEARNHDRLLYSAQGTEIPSAESTAEQREHAIAWMESERQNMLAAIDWAAQVGQDRITYELAAALASFLLAHGYTAESLALQSLALHAARTVGDAAAADLAGEHLAAARWEAGEFTPALRSFEAALAGARSRQDRVGEARLLDRIGFTLERLGAYEQAEDALEQALAIRQELHDLAGEAKVLNSLGAVKWRKMHYGEALEVFMQALEIRQRLGDDRGCARTLNNIGLTFQRIGKYSEAIDHLGQARELATTHKDRHVLSTIANNFAYTLTPKGEPEQALKEAEEGLAISREIGSRYEEARALDATAGALAAQGNKIAARYHWTQSQSLFAELGCPEAQEIAKQLSDLEVERMGHV